MMNIVTVGFILATSVLATGSPQIYATDAPKFLQQSYNPPQFNSKIVNERPIIGVLTQPLSKDQHADPRFKGKTSYIMASYIHALESAGARAVPLIYDGDLETELAKLDHLNGVFYCGGGAEGDYNVFGKAVFEKAKNLNDKGRFMPVWGTCLGFENLAQFVSDLGDDVLERFDANDESYTLEFVGNPAQTKLYSPLGSDVNIFAKLNIAYNHHSWGVSPAQFKEDAGLSSMFTPTAISYDNQGVPFVASMESKDYPFFATQYHPEKAQFIFYPGPKIDHSDASIFYNRYFADFFVDQCRRSDATFASYDDEVQALVENYTTINTNGYDGIDFAF